MHSSKLSRDGRLGPPNSDLEEVRRAAAALWMLIHFFFISCLSAFALCLSTTSSVAELSLSVVKSEIEMGPEIHPNLASPFPRVPLDLVWSFAQSRLQRE
jgi:hypothetical protein